MRVKETIGELRRICQYSREADGTYHMSWWDRVIAVVAVYFTKLVLEIGLSANQVSFISFVITVIGGAFLILPGPGYWLIGIALLGLSEVLAHVDGGVARYNKTASPKGAFCNAMPEQFFLIYTPICISFGLYSMFHNIYPFIFGFLGVMSMSLTNSAILLPYPLLRDQGLLSEALGSNKLAQSEEHVSLVIRYGRFFGHFTILLLAFLISTIVDWFISPFSIGPLTLNARYIGFIIYTLVWLVSAIRNIYLPLRDGIRLRL